MKRTLPALLGTGALALSYQAIADNSFDDRWYLSPNANWIFADSDRDAEDDPGLYLAFGKAISEHFNLEFFLTANDLELEDNSSDFEQRGGGLSALFFPSRGSFSPYVILGVGALNNELKDADNTNPFAELGFGFMKEIDEDGAKLRAEVKHRVDFDDESLPSEDEFNDWVVQLGVVIPFGPRARDVQAQRPLPRPVPVVSAPPPAPEPPPAPPRIKETLVLQGVTFCFDCDHLSAQAKQILDTDARRLIDANRLNDVEVAGHTDSIGSDTYNRDLSQRRATSVRNYLVQKGVDPKRLSAKGYGEAQPIADNSTEAGRRINRRVELRVLE